jgi:dTDP-4-amino-4,6-dideoxygalactose transaminase
MNQGYKKIIIPELPDWKALKKYVERIDDERIYANFGKLNLELMQRLKSHWEHPVNVTTTSSGTSALIGAILAKTSGNSPAKKICILPSYTFIGTISAVISSGFIPFLMDIDPETWDMNIENIKQLSFCNYSGRYYNF